MNHKRRRPKNRRAGCLYCKPHKANGASGLWGEKRSVAREAIRAAQELEDAIRKYSIVDSPFRTSC